MCVPAECKATYLSCGVKTCCGGWLFLPHLRLQVVRKQRGQPFWPSSSGGAVKPLYATCFLCRACCTCCSSAVSKYWAFCAHAYNMQVQDIPLVLLLPGQLVGILLPALPLEGGGWEQIITPRATHLACHTFPWGGCQLQVGWAAPAGCKFNTPAPRQSWRWKHMCRYL